MHQDTLLKNHVQRILLRRLSITVILVSTLFAAISYYHTKDMVTNAIIQASTSQMHIIRGRFKELLARPGMKIEEALQNAVNYPPDSDIHIKEGKFVYALLHKKETGDMGVYEHKKYPDMAKIKDYLAESSKTYPEFGKPDYRTISINGKPYLDLHSRLLKKQGGPAIFLRAIFALSEQTTTSIQTQAVKTVLKVILVVFATALLIYPVITTLIAKISDYSTGLLIAHLETMQALGEAISKRDRATNAHNYRVTIYAVNLAEELGLDPKKMRCLIKGAFLHDVGKIGIHDNILLNKARLSEKEFHIMQKHVQHGLDIIKRSSWLNDAEDVVGCHHEKYDGSGYPNGIKGRQIPLNARIFAIVDVFDALASKRPYKEPFSYEESMKIIEEGRVKHFDPELLDHFIKISRHLHMKFAHIEDKTIETYLQKITSRYFHSNIDNA